MCKIVRYISPAHLAHPFVGVTPNHIEVCQCNLYHLSQLLYLIIYGPSIAAATIISLTSPNTTSAYIQMQIEWTNCTIILYKLWKLKVMNTLNNTWETHAQTTN